MIEFEVKAPVPAARVETVRQRLGSALRIEEHADVYFHHPCRDFATTDEAVRLSLRAGQPDLTYKGPKLDETTKARREIVVNVADQDAARAFLDALGFTEALTVRKSREVYRIGLFTVALDEVPGLGTFLELERMLPENASRDEAERQARELLAEWGLKRTERRSYLELLLAKKR